MSTNKDPRKSMPADFWPEYYSPETFVYRANDNRPPHPLAGVEAMYAYYSV